MWVLGLVDQLKLGIAASLLRCSRTRCVNWRAVTATGYTSAPKAADAAPVERKPLFDGMWRGLREDFKTIWDITTLRYALVGSSSLMFTVARVGAWLPRSSGARDAINRGMCDRQQRLTSHRR